MAGQGRKTFSDGEVLSAADVNGYLMDQSVMRFADSAARTTAIGTPTEGMVSYLDDTNDVEVFDGSDWVNFTGDITNITAGTGLSGGGSEGAVTLDVDYTEVMQNLITTEGDLIIGDASGDPVRLPVGSADQVLTSDGTTVSFQDAAGGGGAELLATIDATGASAVEVTSISNDYQNILVFFEDVFPATDRALTLRISDSSSSAISFSVGLDNTQNDTTEVNITVDEQRTNFTPTRGFVNYSGWNISQAGAGYISAVSGRDSSDRWQYVRSNIKNANVLASEMRFYFSATTFTSGTFKFYGVK